MSLTVDTNTPVPRTRRFLALLDQRRFRLRVWVPDGFHHHKCTGKAADRVGMTVRRQPIYRHSQLQDRGGC